MFSPTSCILKGHSTSSDEYTMMCGSDHVTRNATEGRLHGTILAARCRRLREGSSFTLGHSANTQQYTRFTHGRTTRSLVLFPLAVVIACGHFFSIEVAALVSAPRNQIIQEITSGRKYFWSKVDLDRTCVYSTLVINLIHPCRTLVALAL